MADAFPTVLGPRWGAVPLRRLAPFLPAFVILAGLFLVPMFELVQMSLYEYSPTAVYVPKYTLANYRQFLSDPFYWGMVWTSLKVGSATTLVTLVCAYPVAYYLTTIDGWERTLLSAAYLLPLLVTLLVGTLGWYLILLPFGAAQRLLALLGLLHGPLQVLQTIPALIVVMVYLHLPYAVLILAASLHHVGADKTHAASVLGASRAYILRRVLIPLTMPGIASSAILVFALSISSYLVPVLITGQRVRVLPIAIFSYTTDILNWPLASVLAIVLLVIVVAATYAFATVTNAVAGRGKWETV
jgi:putative spermidine/putrescine transport system permease protein